MKSDKNFRMKQTTKRMLTNLEGEERTAYKDIMIQAQLIAARSISRNKRVEENESGTEI